MVMELTVQPEKSSRSLHVIFILARLITISSSPKGAGGIDGAAAVAGALRHVIFIKMGGGFKGTS
jgi:hypothetical protein